MLWLHAIEESDRYDMITVYAFKKQKQKSFKINYMKRDNKQKL